MLQRIVSILLCLSLIIAFPVSVLASDSETDSSIYYSTSDTGFIEIATSSKSHSEHLSAQNVVDFEIRQYYDGELVQLVSGSANCTELFVTNYQDGMVSGNKIIDISDRITRSTYIPMYQQVDTKALQDKYGSPIGYITYNKTTSGRVERIRVFSNCYKTDNESYTIRGKTSDTLAVITGIVASVLSVFIPAASVWQQIAIAIISAAGGSIAGGAIGVAISEDVAVYAFYYRLTGYDYSTDRYSSQIEGIARRVTTMSSSYYNEWFYDGYTPANWRNNTLAYWFWCDLFGESYPQVSSYS